MAMPMYGGMSRLLEFMSLELFGHTNSHLPRVIEAQLVQIPHEYILRFSCVQYVNTIRQ